MQFPTVALRPYIKEAHAEVNPTNQKTASPLEKLELKKNVLPEYHCSLFMWLSLLCLL